MYILMNVVKERMRQLALTLPYNKFSVKRARNTSSGTNSWYVSECSFNNLGPSFRYTLLSIVLFLLHDVTSYKVKESESLDGGPHQCHLHKFISNHLNA